MGSRVVSEDQSLFPSREAVDKIRRKGRRGRQASNRTKERVHRLTNRFKREKSMSSAILQPWP